MLQLNFTEIVEEGGKQFLLDPRAEGVRCDRAKRFAKAYEDVRRMLVANEYPATREWIEAIAADGSEGLERMVRTETERRIKADAIPPFLASAWRKSCTQEVPAEMWEGADVARRSIVDNGDGLPVKPEDFVFQEERIVDVDAICARIGKACRVEITDDMRAEAERIVSLAKEVRTISIDTGLNALELVRKYARAEEVPAPDSVDVLNDILFRRHEPGRMEQDLDSILNLAAMHYAQMHP